MPVYLTQRRKHSTTDGVIDLFFLILKNASSLISLRSPILTGDKRRMAVEEEEGATSIVPVGWVCN